MQQNQFPLHIDTHDRSKFLQVVKRLTQDLECRFLAAPCQMKCQVDIWSQGKDCHLVGSQELGHDTLHAVSPAFDVYADRHIGSYNGNILFRMAETDVGCIRLVNRRLAVTIVNDGLLFAIHEFLQSPSDRQNLHKPTTAGLEVPDFCFEVLRMREAGTQFLFGFRNLPNDIIGCCHLRAVLCEHDRCDACPSTTR